MEIPENEVRDLLEEGIVVGNEVVHSKKKKKRKSGAPVVPMPTGTPAKDELTETKERLEKVTQEMEGMKSEIESLKMSNAPRPLRIFALGFIPSLILAKSHVDMLKYVSDVLSINMKMKMESYRGHFRVIESVSGVESVGIRTCPVFNRIEYCALKWHHMSKVTRSGRTRADLRIHCCTLCLEALGIICGHPLLRCPWIYEDTWKKIPVETSLAH